MSDNQKPKNVVDLWELAQDFENKSKETKTFERTVIFLGEPSSGKSSIISLLKGTLKEEPPKPTSAVEYSYARRNTDNRKEIVHFYEMAGGKFIKDLTSVPLTLNSIKNVTFVITLDLSNPATVLESLIFWVENIKENFEKALLEIFAHNTAEINDFKQSKFNEFENYAEKLKMSPIFTNVVVLANKYDLFETQEIENRKWMSRILRYYCHTNTLSLYYSSIINPKLTAQIKTLLSGFLFSDIAPNVLQKDHMKPIFISKGLDNIDSIGVTMTGNFSQIDLLKKLSKEYFPLKQSDSQKTYGNIDFSKYSESLIDNTKALKDKVLQKTLKKHKIDLEDQNNKMNLEKNINNTNNNIENINNNYDLEVDENEPVLEKSTYKPDNLYENPSIVKANPSTVKTNNLPNVSNTTPQNFVKKYRPSLNKFSNNNNN